MLSGRHKKCEIITKMCKKVSKKVDKKEKNQIDFDLKVNNLFF